MFEIEPSQSFSREERLLYNVMELLKQLNGIKVPKKRGRPKSTGRSERNERCSNKG
jgi:hypothetical protein